MRGLATTTILALALGAACTGHTEGFTCPAELQQPGATEIFKFRYVSFFDGDPSEMADLAPDEGPDPKKLEQSWQLTRSPGRPIVMVCRYHGTDQTVRKEVPQTIKRCRLGGLVSATGEVVGSPVLQCE